MTRSGMFIVFVVFLVACAPPLSTRLKESVQFAYMRAPCNTIVAIQWPYGFPVPSETSGQYKFFFYPIAGNLTGPVVVDEPTVNATVVLGSDKVLSCDLITQMPIALNGRRWPVEAYHVSMEKSEAQANRLYDRTEALGAIYSAKRPVTPAEKAVANDFFSIFEATAEPPLLPYYYRLNPSFWEWLRTTIGRSIPQAS